MVLKENEVPATRETVVELTYKPAVVYADKVAISPTMRRPVPSIKKWYLPKKKKYIYIVLLTPRPATIPASKMLQGYNSVENSIKIKAITYNGLYLNKIL